MRLSPFTVFSHDPLNLNYELLWNALGVGQVVRISSKLAEQLRNTPEQVEPATLIFLEDKGFLCVDEEIAWEKSSEVIEPKRTETLRLVVMPSGNCQLACHQERFGAYCGQIHRKMKLDGSDVNAISSRIESAIKSELYRNIEIGFFGGEPLLELAFIKEVLSVVNNLIEGNKCQSHSPVNLSASIITNGVLLNAKVFSELWSAGIQKFEVTVDGEAAFHNVRRPFLNGSGSFEIILHNLVSIAPLLPSNSANFVIRCNVDVRNIKGVIPLLNALEKDKVIPPMSFYVAPIRNWGESKARDSFESRALFASLEIEVFKWLIQRGFSPGLLPYPISRTCIALDTDSSVLAPDGNWYSCTETPLSNDIANNHANSKKWNDIQIESWQAIVASGKVPCGRCKFLPVCGGACPKEWIENGVPCPPFVENIEDRLVLWGIINEKSIHTLS